MDTKKVEVQARQGDIFFEVVSSPPESALNSKKRHGTQVLAYGEVTGHTHAIDTPPISKCETLVDENGDIYVKSPEEIVVSHDEHGTIMMPANEWICITHQREYDPLAAEKERRVAD